MVSCLHVLLYFSSSVDFRALSQNVELLISLFVDNLKILPPKNGAFQLLILENGTFLLSLSFSFSFVRVSGIGDLSVSLSSPCSSQMSRLKSIKWPWIILRAAAGRLVQLRMQPVTLLHAPAPRCVCWVVRFGCLAPDFFCPFSTKRHLNA